MLYLFESLVPVYGVDLLLAGHQPPLAGEVVPAAPSAVVLPALLLLLLLLLRGGHGGEGQPPQLVNHLLVEAAVDPVQAGLVALPPPPSAGAPLQLDQPEGGHECRHRLDHVGDVGVLPEANLDLAPGHGRARGAEQAAVSEDWPAAAAAAAAAATGALVDLLLVLLNQVLQTVGWVLAWKGRRESQTGACVGTFHVWHFAITFKKSSLLQLARTT